MQRIWKQIQTDYRQIVLAMLSGLLLTLAFPKIDMGAVAFIALVPLLVAIRQSDWQGGFRLGFACGLIHNLGLIYWTAFTMNTYGHLPMAQAVLVLFLFSIYLSLYPALFGASLAWIRPKPVLLAVQAPLTWIALEMLRTWLFTGFPWGLLGYSLYDHLWIIQSADLFGVYGISGLIVLVNGVATLALLNWLKKDWQGYTVSKPLVKLSAAAMGTLLLCTIGYGIIRIRTVDRAAAAAPHKTIGVVQGNIDQARKWDPRFQMLTTVKYRQLSFEASANQAELIIWPETATPFYFLEDPILTNMVLEGIRATHAYFIIGSPTVASPDDRLIYHNSAFLMSPDGRSLGKYDKVHLVPFGEYVPLKRWLPFIKKMVAQVGDFRPGRKGSTLKWEDRGVGMLICYEIIFPGLSRSMVQNGAELLVNITNDAWFGRTSAAYQHFSMAVLRAVENRRAVARAANTGISGFIDPCGRISQATALYRQATVTAPVAMLKFLTRYSRWGDWPLGLAAFSFLAALMVRHVIRNRPFR